MSEYRRVRHSGGTIFFTVNCRKRGADGLLLRNIDQLREAIRVVKKSQPFIIDAIVVLPDHLHCIWTLPSDDHDYSSRWGLIKGNFSRSLPGKTESVSRSREKRGERGVWQRRFWEHHIRDTRDYNAHVDYIHYNPVKHGYCEYPLDWRYSSFHRFVEAGLYSPGWCENPSANC